jgi:hypothetical protein
MKGLGHNNEVKPAMVPNYNVSGLYQSYLQFLLLKPMRTWGGKFYHYTECPRPIPCVYRFFLMRPDASRVYRTLYSKLIFLLQSANLVVGM